MWLENSISYNEEKKDKKARCPFDLEEDLIEQDVYQEIEYDLEEYIFREEEELN